MDTLFILFGGIVLMVLIVAVVSGARTPRRKSGSDYESGGSDEPGGSGGHDGD